MDRDIVYGLAFSTIALTLIGGWYLGSSKPRIADTALAEVQDEAALEPGATREYAPEDVRYKFEQKAKKQGKRVVNPVAEPSPEPVSTDNEAPPIDDGGDETAEAPPIE